MEARAAVVARDRERAGLVLHREVVAHRAGAVADEVEGGREAAAREEVVEEVVEGFLVGLCRVGGVCVELGWAS